MILYNLLLVDDSKSALFMNKKHLENCGFTFNRIFCARDGLEAIDLLKRETIDIIITDIIMPDMDGFALMEYLKGSAQFSDIPVIPVTALGANQDIERFKELRVSGYLTKPVTPQKLDEVLTRVFSSMENNNE